MIGDYDVDPGVHPHDEAPIFKVFIHFHCVFFGYI